MRGARDGRAPIGVFVVPAIFVLISGSPAEWRAPRNAGAASVTTAEALLTMVKSALWSRTKNTRFVKGTRIESAATVAAISATERRRKTWCNRCFWCSFSLSERGG